jgi:hypothetical protein
MGTPGNSEIAAGETNEHAANEGLVATSKNEVGNQVVTCSQDLHRTFSCPVTPC